jgi:putative membrane protein
MADLAARGVTVAALVLLAQPARIALAHDGVPPEPHDIWQFWSLDAAILLALAALAYGRGLRVLWRRAGTGRGIRRWQAAAYTSGLIVLSVALVSPVDALGSALFSAHMAQHMLLVVVAAPLLVLGRPIVPLLCALPAPARRTLGSAWQRAGVVRAGWRLLTWLPVAWVLHAGVLWVWHLPGPYQAALTDARLHVAEHAAFLGTALLFWWPVVHPGRQGAVGYGMSAVAVFLMSMQGGLLGALMTSASTPWYPAYASSVVLWGLTPLDDQQIGGMVMSSSAGFGYLAATLALLAAWLRAAERRVRHGDLVGSVE